MQGGPWVNAVMKDGMTWWVRVSVRVRVRVDADDTYTQSCL